MIPTIPDTEFRNDPLSKKIYATDASLFEIDPFGVMIPKSTEALLASVRAVCKQGIAVIPRGAATGVTGGCIGNGVIFDTSKYLNRILSIDPKKRTVTCEPGVVLRDLNKALLPYGLQIGPDTSTENRATIGGMVGNNAAGMYSIRYGNMSEHILEAKVVTADGSLITCNNQTIPPTLQEAIDYIKTHYKQAIEDHFPTIKRRASGYNIQELLKPSPNLAKLIAGSEGTLGVISEVTLKAVPLLTIKGVVVVSFETIKEALEAVPGLLTHSPVALELIDGTILQSAQHSSMMKNKLHWLEGNPSAILALAFDEAIPDIRCGSSVSVITDPEEQKNIWDTRKAGLELLLSKRSYTRASAFIEDVAIPPEHAAAFVADLQSMLETVGIYGHVGDGCIHIRPFVNLSSQNELLHMKDVMLKTSEMIKKYKGVMSGEHGDGLIRSWMNRDVFGEKIYEAFALVKQAFDPNNLMNPGKVLSEDTYEDLMHHLRKQPQSEYATFLDFSKEGGFSLSVDMCNGNGLCRKDSGLMCPSYQATKDEFDSTRARAEALRSLANGQLPLEDVMDVLDLCIECKGCKTSCPSQVDMAKMKAELLFQHQEKHGYSLRSRLFANIPNLFAWGSYFPRLFNLLAKLPKPKWLGISPQRSLPTLSHERFSKQVKQADRTNQKSVVLFTDTFTEFNCPEVGLSAIKVLEHMGFHVILPSWKCCGRTWISKGFLKQAKVKAEALVDHLTPFANEGIPIIGLEPSCLFTLKDEFLSLLGYNHKKALQVAEVAITFDQFIEKHKEKLKLQTLSKSVHHTHCHQKAIDGSPALIANSQEIPSGCCGMAGSFGYEKEHYSISMKIGEKVLFPVIRGLDNDTEIIANGYSCRSQIPKKSLHLAEFLANHIDA